LVLHPTDDPVEKSKRQSILYGVAFATRCSAGAIISYLLASSIALQHPVWAAMSSLIVVKDDERATQHAALVRVLGTCAGIAISVLVASLPVPASMPIAVDIGVSVALCAALTHRYPSMRVAMWTAPLVYLSQAPGTDLWHSGLWRGLEVLLGAAIGAGLQWASTRAIKIFE
jgi:uncharacterized membrane protein YccC